MDSGIPTNRGPHPDNGDACLKFLPEDTVDGRNPANQLRLVAYPIIYRVLYILGGGGFCPSTVSHPFLYPMMDSHGTSPVYFASICRSPSSSVPWTCGIG